MADEEEPTVDPVGRKSTVNLDNYSPTTRQVVEAVIDIAKAVFGVNRASVLAGSGSVKVDNKVVAKVMPQEPGAKEYVLIGVSTDYAPETWPKPTDSADTFDGAFLVQQSPFHFFLLPQDRSRAEMVAKTVFTELKKRLG